MVAIKKLLIAFIILDSLIFLSGCAVIPPYQRDMPTESDLSKIEISPGKGDYFQYQENYSKILLLNYSLTNITLKREDICLSDDADPGDPGILISGYLKNEYDKDYWVCLSAKSFDPGEKLLGRSTDSGPICRMIARHVESNKTEKFELHLKYDKKISEIQIGLRCISDIVPP